MSDNPTRFCTNCGAEVSGAGRFCGSCGAPVGEAAANAVEVAFAPPTPRRASHRGLLIAGIAAVAALVVGAIVAATGGGDDAAEPETTTVVTPTTTTVPETTTTSSMTSTLAPTTVPTTMSPPTSAAPLDPQAEFDKLADGLGSIDRSKLSRNSCGTWGMVVLRDRIKFFEWNGTRWQDRSQMLGPDGDTPPLKVTSHDYNGDGQMDYLVQYDGTVYMGHIYGGIFVQYECNWRWADFMTLGGNVTQTLDVLGYDRELDTLTAQDFLPQGGRVPVVVVWDYEMNAFYTIPMGGE